MMLRLRRHSADLLHLLPLIVLPLLWFGPVLFTSKTLLPYDNLYQFQPWRDLRPDTVPHNALLSDLVLDNAVWKLHIRRTLANGEIPLWNPQIFAGMPFFAAGLASVAYFLSALFYVLPLEAAYGWFTAIQVAFAGINAYAFGRTLKLRPVAALLAGILFQFSGFLIVRVVFTMIVAAAVWLPLLLAIIEKVIQRQEEKGLAGFRPIPYVVAGAAVIGLIALAGHPEFLYYSLLVAGLYTASRLLIAWRRIRTDTEAGHPPSHAQSQPGRNPRGTSARILRALGNTSAWLLLLVILGLAIGAVQLLPLFEFVVQNFREGSAPYQKVIGWSLPTRHILTFALPDIFGNPSHHHWFDLWDLRWRPVTVNRLGEPIDTIFWGIKNYVEGGTYLGIGTWALAALAGVVAFSRTTGASTSGPSGEQRTPRRPLRVPTILLSALALLSLLFAFGTPLYALLFYGLPGWNQLHSPFRWVYPFTLAMAVLGGIGLEQALCLRSPASGQTIFGLGRFRLTSKVTITLFSSLFIAAGLTAALVVVISYFLPGPFIDFALRVVEGSDLAQSAFADGRVFWGYQSVGIARFGTLAAVSGVLLWALARKRREESLNCENTATPRGRTGQTRLSAFLPYAFIAVLFVDLYSVHGGFNPTTPSSLSPLNTVPPVVRFINEKEGAGSNPQIQFAPFRFTTFDVPGSKTFNANAGMYYGWQDIRGYDSIITGQYVALMNRIADQSDELLFNRIAPIYARGTPANGGNPYVTLENPLLDLLGVRYIFSELVIPNSDTWKKVYEDSAVNAYQNLEAFPRAFIVAEALVLPPEQQPLLEANLRRTVFIEETPAADNALVPSSPQVGDTSISRYTANNVFIDVNLSDRGWLVLTDAYDSGWKAYLRPFGGGENDEQELEIYRANSAFRAVYLPRGGQWTVRFTYSPMSFKVGLYISFLTAMLSILLLLWWAWGRFYRPEADANQVRTIAKNSLVPMALNLANRGVYYVFAMLYMRVLAPEGAGKYLWVISVYGIFEIMSRYGLGTLLTREVSTDKSRASTFLTNVLALRTLLWAASLFLMALVVGGNWLYERIGQEEIQAVAVFALVMLVANWSDAFSNLFYAFEKMEYPAGLGIAIALLQATLGALALLLGWGILGLAWVALVVNLVQLIWLFGLVNSTLFKPQWKWDWPLQKWMLSTSGPLMVNHLLATIFWRIDIWLLLPLVGAASVGLYSAALKYLDGLNIIPSTFTLAIFPLMSRLARQDGAALLRSYTLSLRLLLLVSLPVAMTVTLLAHPLIAILGGARFTAAVYEVSSLPPFACRLAMNLFESFDCHALSFRGGAALALQVMIWSIPVGFVNSVTQYVLIASDQQRYLTRAFIAGVLFNLAGNLLLIPVFSYIGAAVVTILSEFCLLLLFSRRVRQHVGTVTWPDLVWRPALSAAAMGSFIFVLSAFGASPWASILPAWAVYTGVFALLGGFADEDLRAAAAALLKRRLSLHPQEAAENR
ncbi:MAG: oligosaccharide flippase family protein [Caldilineaceae bacterium]|nr:oligosaccharide flippase family protein [Caldilineaceae bacterium]